MSADRELEIKFRTDAAGLKAALASTLLPKKGAADAPRTSLNSVYFDTPSRDLKKQKIVLRVRKSRSAYVMGLKWVAPPTEGPYSRGEIEVEARGPEPEIDLFKEEIASELKRLAGGQPLEPQFETQIKRRVRTLDLGRGVVEAAFDEGFIVAGENRLPATEIELELKSGEPASLYELAIRCAESLPICLEPSSKAERGFLVAAGENPTPVFAGPLQFPAEATVDDAVTTIIGAALNHFLANWPALNPTHGAEAIHQMRVALRRLRIALALFKRALPSPEFETFRIDSKQIGCDLEAARSWDVMREMIEGGPLTHYQRSEGFNALLKAVEGRRCTAYAAAKALIDNPATSRFVLRMQAFLAGHAWRNSLGAGELSALTAPAQHFAAGVLDRLHQRALKRGKRLLRLSSAERHQVRISLKKVRYAAEFFSELFSARARKKPYLRRVARLQDLLGAANDAACAEGLLHDLGTTGPEVANAAGIVLGWYGRGAQIADDDLQDAWSSFARNDPFWR